MTEEPVNLPLVAALARIFEQKDISGIAALLADDVELRPPTYGKSWHGRDLVAALLGIAAESFDSLRYTDALGDKDLHVLRFEAMVGGKPLSGVDVVRLDQSGKISVFEIFSRPPKVALAFLDRMTARIMEEPEVGALMAPAPRD